MAKLVIKRIVIFVGLLMICQVMWIVEVYHLFMPVDAVVDAVAWFDENGNGERELDESGLADVCIWEWVLEVPDTEEISLICENPFLQTDNTGNWPNSDDYEWLFLPGADCNNVYIFANPPTGYHASTPLVVNDCYAEFGFMLENTESQDQVLAYAKQIQRWKIVKWLENAGILLAMIIIAGVVSISLVRPEFSEG